MPPRLVGICVVLLLFILLTVKLLRWARPQFSLRRLLLVVTLVALGFSAFFSWRALVTAKMTWLDPSQVSQVKPTTTITEEGGEFKATFTPNWQDASQLHNLAEQADQSSFYGSFGARMLHQQQQVELHASDRKKLERFLAAMRSGDVPAQDQFVIHGRVEDPRGRPVPGATVDLLGPYVYINHFQTRDDGTFTMILKPPPGSGYYLQIRYGDKSINTRQFSLQPEIPALLVKIQVR